MSASAPAAGHTQAVLLGAAIQAAKEEQKQASTPRSFSMRLRRTFARMQPKVRALACLVSLPRITGCLVTSSWLHACLLPR